MTDRYLTTTGYSGPLTDELLADASPNLFDPVCGDDDAHGRFDHSAQQRSTELYTDGCLTAFYALGLAGVDYLAH